MENHCKWRGAGPVLNAVTMPESEVGAVANGQGVPPNVDIDKLVQLIIVSLTLLNTLVNWHTRRAVRRNARKMWYPGKVYPPQE